MSEKDKIHSEAMVALITNALTFNAAVVSYATQVLAVTGGLALKPRSSKRVGEDFRKMGKDYQEKYDNIIKDFEARTGALNG